jgi:hypothetical protein
MSYFTPTTITDKSILADQKNAQLLMLTFIFCEFILAAYIRTASNIFILFAQSLATMLIFAGHVFVSVGYFSGQQNATFNAGLAVYIASILLSIAVVLHLCYFVEPWLNQRATYSHNKNNYKSDDPFAEVDALYNEY